MALSSGQKAALKAFIEADAGLNANPNTNVGNSIIAAVLNVAASPEFVVWRTSVGRDEITQADAWAWIEVDNLTVGKARIWEWLFEGVGSINASKANVRAGIAECWSGTAAKLAVQAAVLGVCKRPALLIEKIFSTGTGSTGSPAIMGREGTITTDEIEEARAS